ncbi:hypothetical protein F8280_17745 [Micromonospora noduli]|uniref:Lipoprotein n=1 Tax=Micromonospora noduli TaxID=709876 RepID=A0ABX9D6I9_9ACTN|nr:hypothetical protein [Micromonospora noduli]KAB1922854.1 hypothetical protein F8280_17745 [Micromonospora noduli]RAO23465.1 hypothetical protein MED15_01306 [Micromonospora noduli]
MRVGRPAVCLAIGMVVPLLVVGGCTSDTTTRSAAPSEPPPTGPSQPTSTPEAPTGWFPTGRVLLAGPLAEQKEATITEVVPSGASFTVYFVCTGGGRMALDVKAAAPLRYPCDGVPNLSQVFVDKGVSTDLAVRVEGEAQWRLAVVDGAP